MGRTPGWIRDYFEWGIQFIKRARLQTLQESRDFPLQLMGTGEMPSNLGEIIFASVSNWVNGQRLGDRNGLWGSPPSCSCHSLHVFVDIS